MDLNQAFLDFALLGADWVLWLLVVLSIVSIGVMIDRGLWLRGRGADTADLRRQLRRAAEDGTLDDLSHRWRDATAIAARVGAAGLHAAPGGADAAAEAMHAERSKWRRDGEKNLVILGTLGNNVPFVGLFGTVLGIIEAFSHLKTKTPEAEALALGGISGALVATAIGLLVAIPAVVAYNLFNRRLRVLMTGADEVAHAVLSHLHGEDDDEQPARAPAKGAG